jgi:hypothetical protein
MMTARDDLDDRGRPRIQCPPNWERRRHPAARHYFSAARYPANASSSFLDSSWAGILLPG